MLRSLLLVGLGLLAGCPAEDAPPDLAPRIAPSVQVTTDVVGYPTRLDASGSSDAEGRTLGYAWEVVSVPPGSQVTTATLSARSGAQVSFEPDLGGEYQLRVTAAADGESVERVVLFTVPTVPLFFYQGSGLSAQQLGVGIMRSDGTGKRLLSCAIKALSPDGGTPSDLYGSLRFSGLFGLRAWEPPKTAAAGAPWRVTFLEVVPTPDGTQAEEFRLWAGDENSGCDTEPARRIDSTGFTNDHRHFYPRFSPDGNRVLYVDEPQDASAFTFRLMTIAIDRTQQRQIRGGMPQLKGVPPAWYDATHVVWVEDLSTTATPHLVIYKASDNNAAGDTGGDRTVLLDCGGVLNVINQIEVLDGDILISGGEKSTIGPGAGALEIYRMKPGACTLASKIASEPVRGMAWDFAVSPDGKSIVYMATFGPGGTKANNDLWVVPSDGSAPPRYFAGNPKYYDFGPRWVAGGRQIVWTQAADGEPPRGGGLMIANADGSHQRALYRENMLGRVIGGSNQGTSCAYGGAPRDVEILLALVLLATACRIWWRLRRGDRAGTRDSRTE
jgi:hypothetical protein